MMDLAKIEGRRVAHGTPGTSEYRTGIVTGLILDEALLHVWVDWDSGDRSLILADVLDWLDEPNR